jgi:glucan phosphoethanolaminetransferase (alkaline phosphatase superfamily)
MFFFRNKVSKYFMNTFFDFSPFIIAVGSLIFLVAFVIYNKDILRGNTRPNIVTWSLFALITLINSTSYISMTGDLVKSVLAFTDFFVCAIITFFILFKGYYSKLSIFEKLVIVFSAASIFAWVIFRSATFANLLLQPGYILAFIPTYVNAYKNPLTERALPWFLWAFSFILSIIVVIMRWEGAWQDIVNPSIALLLHFGVGMLALRKKHGISN